MQEQNEIEGLYRKYYGDVYRYLLSLCRNCHAAEDLSQNTFLKVISGIRGFRGSCTVKTWIFTIARHEYYHWLRANPPTEELTETAAGNGDILEQCENREQAAAIFSYIDSLEEPHRSLLILRLVNEFSFREIGLMLEKTENWARVTFMRDKCRLIRYLEEKENKGKGKENGNV